MKIRSLFIVFIVWGIAAVGQSFDYLQAAQTYWKYRYRLVGDNIQSDSSLAVGEPGFMIRGEGGLGSGLSAPARSRKPDKPTGGTEDYWTWESGFLCGQQPIYNLPYLPGIIDWGDGQGDDLGGYLAVLATEWKLLHDNGESTAKTELELCYALKTFNRYEEYEYQVMGLTAQENGIFYRDDVPWDLARTTIYNSPFTSSPYKYFGAKYNIVSSNASCGVYINGQTVYGPPPPNSMSIDEAVKMLWGLVFVRKCLPASGIYSTGWGGYPGDPLYDLGAEAGSAIYRLINYIKYNPYGQSRWHINDPLGNKVRQGNAAGSLAYPLMEIANKYSGRSFTDFYAQTTGRIVWNLMFENQLLRFGSIPPFYGNLDWETKLMIMRGLRPVAGSEAALDAFGINLATLCIGGCTGNSVMEDIQQECYSNSGLIANWPYQDLASAFLNDHSTFNNASFWQQFLTQVPFASTYTSRFLFNLGPHAQWIYGPLPFAGFYDFPCELPVSNYTAANGVGTLDPNAIRQRQQYNGLDYMLFYNLYCLEFPSNFTDAANGLQVKYCDLQDRIITAQYPLTAMAIDNTGTQANHAVIGAETSMHFQGSNVASGTYIDFIAPHISAPLDPYIPNQYIYCHPGSVCTFNIGRPDCGSVRGDNYKVLPATHHQGDTTGMASIQYLLDSLHIGNHNMILNKDSVSTDYKVMAYPNPIISGCKITLDLPNTADVSIQVNDIYGRLVLEVLKESPLNAGEFNYQFQRGTLSSGSYMLSVTINGKIVVKKLTII